MGNMVNIWNDAWLIDDNNRFIETQVVKGLETMHVYDLMVDNGSRWDVQMIDSLFQKRDVIAIQGIPLSSRGVGDKLIWHCSKDERFNVKLAYHVAMEICGLDLGEAVQGA
jgi:DNA mismatch repair protein MutH